MLRISLSSSGGAERRPSSRLTVIGKKQISATIASFGPDAVAEGEHEQRREHDDRDRLRSDQQGVGGVAQGPQQVHGDREQHPGDHGERQAEHHLDQRHARRCPSAGSSRRAARRRSRPGRRASGRRPSRARRRPARRARTGRPGRARARPSCPSASSARALTSANAEPVTERGRGRSTSKSATTRPGRGDSTTIRSARKTASSTSCVTSRTVRGSSASAAASHSRRSARVIASRAPKGSSSSSTGRPCSSVRRNATRWRIPPDSAAGRDVLELGQAEALEQRLGPLGAPRRARTPWHSSASAALASASRQGSSRSRWGM